MRLKIETHFQVDPLSELLEVQLRDTLSRCDVVAKDVYVIDRQRGATATMDVFDDPRNEHEPEYIRGIVFAVLSRWAKPIQGPSRPSIPAPCPAEPVLPASVSQSVES